MKIYITRHSKTLWNEQKRLQGRLDSPLTQEGIDNALALKKYLTDNALQFDCVYSSPIPRAYQTACLLFGQEKVITDDRYKIKLDKCHHVLQYTLKSILQQSVD